MPEPALKGPVVPAEVAVQLAAASGLVPGVVPGDGDHHGREEQHDERQAADGRYQQVIGAGHVPVHGQRDRRQRHDPVRSLKKDGRPVRNGRHAEVQIYFACPTASRRPRSPAARLGARRAPGTRGPQIDDVHDPSGNQTVRPGRDQLVPQPAQAGRELLHHDRGGPQSRGLLSEDRAGLRRGERHRRRRARTGYRDRT